MLNSSFNIEATICYLLYKAFKYEKISTHVYIFYITTMLVILDFFEGNGFVYLSIIT